MRVEAGFGKSTEGNKRLINQLLRRARLYSDAAIDRAEARGDFETAREIERFMSLDLSLDSDADSTDKVEVNSDGVYMPTTLEQFDTIPVGAEYIDPESKEKRVKTR